MFSRHPDTMKTPCVSLLLGVCVLLLSALTVSAGLILEIPPDPVPVGSDVTLRCRQNNGDIITAHFFFNGNRVGSESKSLVITNVQQSDEGLYSCATNKFGSSPQSFLRVRGAPPPSPQTATPLSPPVPSTLSIHPPASSPPPPPSWFVPVVAGLVSVVLLVLVVVGVLLLWRKLKVSGLFLLTAAGVCVLLLSALTVSTAPPLSSESVLRLFCHLVVFCPYCISTGLLLSICSSRRTPNKPAVSMEMTQRDGGGQGLAEDGRYKLERLLKKAPADPGEKDNRCPSENL
ncbi:hypothetical protein ACER0C_003196 [Sarotherodon galilaeus]